MQEVIKALEGSDNVLILSHKNPDGDALGSSLGLALALRGQGKRASVYSINEIPQVFSFLPGIGLFKEEPAAKAYGLVVLLDCALFSRTGIEDLEALAASFDSLAVIDHHPRTSVETAAHTAVWIDEKKSSTSVMIYELLRAMEVPIDKDIATCLLTGIFTDTGGFQHNNTDEGSLMAAAELMKKGPRIDRIARNIFQSKSLPAIKLWGTALARLETNPQSGMAVSYVSCADIREAGAKQEDLAGLISLINTVSDAKFSLLLTEYDDHKIKGSLRSEEYNGVDVSKIAAELGGGGHKLASGFEAEASGDFKKNIAKITRMVLNLRDKTNKDK